MAQVSWTGREAKILRDALRLSQRDFAKRLGVSRTTVGEWEKRGEDITLSTDSQAMLDTLLTMADQEGQDRFAQGLDSCRAHRRIGVVAGFDQLRNRGRDMALAGQFHENTVGVSRGSWQANRHLIIHFLARQPGQRSLRRFHKSGVRLREDIEQHGHASGGAQANHHFDRDQP